MGAFKKVALVALGAAAAYGVAKFIKEGSCKNSADCNQSDSNCNGEHNCDGSKCKCGHESDLERCRESAAHIADNLKKYSKEMKANFEEFVKTHSVTGEEQNTESTEAEQYATPAAEKEGCALDPENSVEEETVADTTENIDTEDKK